MNLSIVYVLAANIILFIHISYVIFVVGGMILIFVGNVRGWTWIRNPWFRLIHLLAIIIVIIQSWLNTICVLTTLEMALRNWAGTPAYSDYFIVHWLEKIISFHPPLWAYAVVYTLFGGLVAASRFWIPPQPFKKHWVERAESRKSKVKS